MAAPRDAADLVIIGGGFNGLVAASLLGRAGFRPLVLEQRDRIGGIAGEREIHPGFRCPAAAHSAGPVLSELAAELRLSDHGLQPIAPAARLLALTTEGPGIALWADTARTARELAPVSPRDAARYPEFVSTFAKIGRMLRPLLTMTPPSLEEPALADAWRMLKLGRGFRGLGRKDAYRLLRWGPMAVADLAGEWFETDLLRAAVAARGVQGAFAGPWSAGTCAGLLLQSAVDGSPLPPAAFFRGGMGSLSRALEAAAGAAGARVRTGVRVARILTSNGRVEGVALASGEEIPARAVVSGIDPKSTLLDLIDPGELDPDFALKVRNYRCLGSAAVVRFALSRLPAFRGVPPASGGDGALSGRIHIGEGIDAIERAFDAAKYGGFCEKPYLDMTIPSIADPGLAPAGAHVMLVHAQWAPYRLRGDAWPARREQLGDTVQRFISDHAPGFADLVVARDVLAPPDLEAEFGLYGGHLLHGEPALDQLFTMRPLLGWARYRTPIDRLYLCGAGTHPGGGVTGAPGANAAREILRDLRRES